jgi:asparagine synthetase B (glutamine-hydrolysing)
VSGARSGLLAASAASGARWDDVVRAVVPDAPGPQRREWNGSRGRIAVWGPLSSLASTQRLAVAVQGRGPADPSAASLLRRYLAGGLDHLRGVKGSFSFVVIDDDRAVFAGGRDVLGRCGLAWHGNADGLWFSTGVVDLLAAVAEGARWDRVYLADWFLGLASQPQARTAFEGVHRCPPGEAVLVEGGEITRRRLDEISASGEFCSLEAGARRLQSVTERAMAGFDDRSVLMLSGGLDSTLLATAWSRSRSFGAITYQLPGTPPGAEETRRVQRLRGGARYRVHVPARLFTAQSLDSWVRDVAPLLDDPPVNAPALLPARWFSYREAARRGFSVVVNGEGGDEIFAIGTSPAAVWRDRSRLRALALLCCDGRYRSVLMWKRFLADVLPVPERLGRSLMTPSSLLPAGVTGEFRRSDAAAAALGAFAARLRLADPGQRLLAILTSAATAGAQSALERLGETAGVRVASPLWDADVARVALSVSPADQLRTFVSKPLPAEAIRLWGDREISSPATADDGYQRLVEVFSGQVARSLESRVAGMDPLASWVAWKPPGPGRRTRPGPRPEFLVRLWFGATWMAAVRARCNVR